MGCELKKSQFGPAIKFGHLTHIVNLCMSTFPQS